MNKLLILLIFISCSPSISKDKRKQIIFDLAAKLEKPGENYHGDSPDKASVLLKKKKEEQND